MRKSRRSGAEWNCAGRASISACGTVVSSGAYRNGFILPCFPVLRTGLSHSLYAAPLTHTGRRQGRPQTGRSRRLVEMLGITTVRSLRYARTRDTADVTPDP